VILKTARNAWLTASSVGKAFETSGSSSTKLVPARYLLEYLPRTPPFIVAKSYSGRRSLDLGLIFFIELLFVARCSPGANDPHYVIFFRMRHYQHALSIRHSNGEKSLIVWVWNGPRRETWLKACQHGRGLVKIDPVLLKVRGGLLRVPLENHIASIGYSMVEEASVG
jgi:hypothetical protein